MHTISPCPPVARGRKASRGIAWPRTYARTATRHRLHVIGIAVATIVGIAFIGAFASSSKAAVRSSQTVDRMGESTANPTVVVHGVSRKLNDLRATQKRLYLVATK